MIKFSIIIPAYNSEKTILDCVNSVLNQKCEDFSYEVIVVDDCSKDSTMDLVRKLQSQNQDKVTLLQNKINSGPGVARDYGIENAKGSWILLLDSDDTIKSGVLQKLHEHINSINKEVDVIALDWAYSDSKGKNILNPCNKNLAFIQNHSRKQLLNAYLSMKMDGHVFSLLIKTDLLKEYSIKHNQGYHEDIYFLFKVYYYSKEISIFDDIVVVKFDREDSIINTIETKHIIDFFKAYHSIVEFLIEIKKLDEFIYSVYLGIIGLVATRIRFIFALSSDIEKQKILLDCLYDEYKKISGIFNNIKFPEFKTKYFLITEKFLKIYSEKNNISNSAVTEISEFLKDISAKTWSCQSIQNSLFLRPDEVRTCCKRFFVNGAMRGDVSLFKTKSQDVSATDIVLAKKELHRKINSAEPNPCESCPFLEFKAWEPFSDINIENLYFEYHSICNLRCVYCCETYYNSQKPAYNVLELFKSLIKGGYLQKCKSIVYAGGEPLLEKSFTDLITLAIEKVPNANHRVLTNSVIYSENIYNLLKEGKISITTSIDAGTAKTFAKIRGADKFEQVLTTLEKYAQANAGKITIKYIFIPDVNTSIEEVKAFVQIVEKYHLKDTNIQISYNFKNEEIDKTSFIGMLAMYALLTQINCGLIFFDDLVLQRFPNLSEEDELYVINELKKMGLNNVIADKHKYDEVIIWGAGEQGQRLVEKSLFFKKVKPAYFVDDYTPNIIGTKFLGFDVKHPTEIINSNLPVVISAVQAAPIIFEKFKKMKIDRNRLIEEVII